MTADETMREIAKQVTICEKCELHFSRKNAVPGEGPVNAQILFIGEGPGFHENEQGRPFVGQAGKFLDELLTHAGLKREEVFITNVVKCRPPSNRDPLPEELNACGNYLDKQIESIDPWVIVTLGRFSMAKYLPMARISAIHGKPAWVGDRLILPMYHPAAALHQPKLKSDIIADFVGLPKAIEQAQKVRKINLEPIIEETYQTSSATESPEQLSLF